MCTHLAHAHSVGLRSALHAEAARLGRVGRGRLRARRHGRRPSRHRVDRRARCADRGGPRIPLAHRGEDDPRRVLRQSRPQRAERAGRALPRAGSKPRAPRGLRRRVTLRQRARAGDGVRVVGRPAHPRRSSTVSSRRTRHSSAIADGPGCTTRHPTRRRRAGPASGTTATPTSPRGSSSTSPASCSPGTSTSRRSCPTGPGSIGSVPRSVFNAGRQIGPVPTRIELDTETATARWTWMEGVEERSSFEGY